MDEAMKIPTGVPDDDTDEEASPPGATPPSPSPTASRAVTADDRRLRQAVVVIHGIGEQRPMDTLRGFANAVLSDNPAADPKYRSKPDAMSELLETRCLQAPGSRQRPLTDFYEYYWAHHMKDARYAQVAAWLKNLMFRSPAAIPPALGAIYYISWLLLLLGGGLLLWEVAAEFARAGDTASASIKDRWPLAAGLGVFVVQWLGAKFILGYVADAARYLSPTPDNIEARNKIRSEGVKLLRTLHQSGKYSRIVIVGHSLGSVIGYDILRSLWTELRKPALPYPCKQEILAQFEARAKAIDPAKGETLEAFRQWQHKLWQEFRVVGVPWLVTDFITLGSPLAHGQLLMADNPDDFARKKLEYEYPTCPPGFGEPIAYNQKYVLARPGQREPCSVFIAHHGAAFACTRWTNLYFPYRRLIRGDVVGGPLGPVFGNGIRDIPVTPSGGGWLAGSLAAHTFYWSGAWQAGKTPRKEAKPAVNALIGCLGLDFKQGTGAQARPGAFALLELLHKKPKTTPPGNDNPAPCKEP